MNDFERELVRYLPNLRRYARTLTRDSDRADDLLQTTFLRALEKQSLYQAGTNLRAWLFTILHNLHINNLRNGIRNEAVELTELNAPPIASKAETCVELKEMRHALALLPRSMREALIAIAQEGESYQRAASLLGTELGTVRSRVSRGRSLIREMMEVV